MRRRSAATRAHSTTPRPARPPSKTLLAAGIAVVTAIPFLRVLLCSFVNFDDGPYILENGIVQQGLSLFGLRWAFTTFHSFNWHPLTWLSHMLDCQLFGVAPGGHHLTALLLHALNAALVFLVFDRLTGARWRSVVLALLFAVHPLRVESVVWVSERKDLLCALFWMLTMWAYVDYARTGRASRYVLALVWFALGVMSKPMIVTLPFVLLLLDAWPLGRAGRTKLVVSRSNTRTATGGTTLDEVTESVLTLEPAWRPWLRLVVEKAPFMLLAAFGSVMTFMAQRSGGSVVSFASIPWSIRLPNAIAAYGAYVWKTLWPTRLSALYPYRPSVPLPELIAAIAMLVVVSVVAWRQRSQRPAVTIGWLWFIGTLVPVIGLIQVGSQAMADRYTYLPSLGLGLALVWWAADGLEQRAKVPRAFVALAMAGLVIALSLRTNDQIRHWMDSSALFEQALSVTGPNPLIEESYGKTLVLMGRYDDARRQLDAAIRHDPMAAEAYVVRGLSFEQQGDTTRAAADYTTAAKIDTNLYEAQAALQRLRGQPR